MALPVIKIALNAIVPLFYPTDTFIGLYAITFTFHNPYLQHKIFILNSCIS